MQSSVCSATNSGRRGLHIQSASCNFRKIRYVVFSLLCYKFREARLTSSICFLQLQEDKEDKICCLQSAPLQLQGGKSSPLQILGDKADIFDLLPIRSVVFSLLRYKFREARLTSSICFLQLQEDKICCLQSAPLQLQGGKADIFDLLPATSGR
ncbi:UDP-N-acetylmuramoylalanine--D-glutamate ligase [Gossypium australe]|uniref:UDP-N-acetylmuramoylalanine--D-glutamate ligase n=1 Tax=Gossypium australe TaxID=47621 RepID=A0A5B6U2X5_9ROSI|nr:UDP-N-acetylmuramoylalanine--D-glutamate ligase [Gossypium australe]